MIKGISYRPRDPDSENLEERYRGVVTLPKNLLPLGEARKLDEARWAADAHEQQGPPDDGLRPAFLPGSYLTGEVYPSVHLMDCLPDLRPKGWQFSPPQKIGPGLWDMDEAIRSGSIWMRLIPERHGARESSPYVSGMHGDDEAGQFPLPSFRRKSWENSSLPSPPVKRSNPWAEKAQPQPWPAPKGPPRVIQFASRNHDDRGSPNIMAPQNRNPTLAVPRSSLSAQPELAEGRRADNLPYLSSLHNEIRHEAARYPPAPGTQEWSNWDGLKSVAGHMFNIEAAAEQEERFKQQWIGGYGDAIHAAAKRFDIPPELLAGIADLEIGGKPYGLDGFVNGIRNEDGRHIPVPAFLPSFVKGAINNPKDETSYGPLAIQVRRAAPSLGYGDRAYFGESQERMVRESLKDPATNLFIVAKHLSDLRDKRYGPKSASEMGPAETYQLGAMYNGGPEVSPKNTAAWRYGRDLVVRVEKMRQRSRPRNGSH